MGPNNEKYITATDQTLVEWSITGDRPAFDALTMRYRDQIKSLLRSRLGNAYNSQDVDDLLQDSLIKAFMNLGSYNPKYTFGQWIFTITKNTFVDFYRKQHDEKSLDEKFALSPEELSPNPEQSIINSQTRSQIDECIEQLSEQHKTLFTMRFIEELSYEEIAEKLNMPMGSVKTNIHRSRAQICTLLVKRENL
ncbi:MAG: RNA polymerase sigma factor [Rikenellaceae bacterium]